MTIFPASSQGPAGRDASFTLESVLRRTLAAASTGFAILGSSDFQAFLSQPIRIGRERSSIDAEYVKAARSSGSVPRSLASWPAIAAKMRAQSSAERARGPILSIEGESAMAP